MNLQYLQYYINRGTCNTYFLIVFMQITHIAHQLSGKLSSHRLHYYNYNKLHEKFHQ